MITLPRSYRADKYIFYPNENLEDVLRVGAVRPVGKGPKAQPFRDEPLSRTPFSPIPEDAYVDEPYHQESEHEIHLRTLWHPTDTPEILKKPHRILIALSENKENGHSISLGQAIADSYGAELWGLHILPKGETNISQGKRKAEIQETWRQLVGKTPQRLYFLEHDSVFNAVQDFIRQEQIPLLLMGPGSDKVSQKLGLSPLAARFLKESEIPVLLVKGIATKLPQRLLILLDGSAFSYPAILQGMVLARDWGVELSLLHIFEEKSPLGKITQEQNLLQSLQWKKLPASIQIQQGDLLDHLETSLSQAEIDWILLATHRETLEQAEDRGSLSLDIARLAQKPLWIVHPQ